MKRIMIIEDEESTLEVLYYNITRRGYDVGIARDGEDGLRMILHCLWDLVLLDIKLPGIDGWEVLQRINSAGHVQSKIVIISAGTQKCDRIRAQSQNVTLFVAKPFDLPLLLGSIAQLSASPPTPLHGNVEGGMTVIDLLCYKFPPLRTRRGDNGVRPLLSNLGFEHW